MNITSNKPKPHYRCFECLRKLGYGYDRTAKHFYINRKQVYRWFKYHKSTAIRPELARRIWDKRTPNPNRHQGPVNWETKWALKWKNKPQRNLRIYLRTKLWQFFKFGRHPKTTPILIGCSREQLQQYISSKFTEGMTLENYTIAWEFDHIKPLNSFDLTVPEQRKQAFHYTNLQPLSPHDNAVKAYKI